jgi:2-dehydro-3-deoxyglucarate aldolase
MSINVKQIPRYYNMTLSWQQIPSPLVSELLCLNSQGVVIDTEHGCFNNETIFSCIQTIKLKQKFCFIRLTEIDKTQIRYCLDAGVDGIIFSTIETEEQCRKIIDFSCYPPRGSRGLGLVRQNEWGEKDLICEDPMLIPQIETKLGIDNLKEILSFDFDYYLIGPYDLSLSLGSPGDFKNENFLLHIDRFNDIITEDKRAIHIPDNVEEKIKGYEKYGSKVFGNGYDRFIRIS